MKIRMLFAVASIFFAQTSLSSQYGVPFELKVDAYATELRWQQSTQIQHVSYAIVGKLCPGIINWYSLRDGFQSIGIGLKYPGISNKIGSKDTAKTNAVTGEIIIRDSHRAQELHSLIEMLESDEILYDVKLE